uniref:Putative E4 protein n=1 Tax=human papillomavirus 71 TaxID=120686 RepID=Q6EGP8_9PAPI|nr:putative E4 protein [human papillomavirus 71]
MMHSTPLCLAPRTPSKTKYPLLNLLTTGPTRTPNRPPPPPKCWAPTKPKCRPRHLSDSDSETDSGPLSSPILQKHHSSWHVSTLGPSVTLTAHTSTGGHVTVTVHL